eukprot:TRINITY_DN414_c0_g2_i1.p1 TRINITY_DN414_c0_g2~~TRINITY_DN414_c0_g2_i1.p1  ORF type:complete len:1096 (+),score=281.01 TRINITY_DN414_c0_g2_i1:53-3340(+)
MGFSFGGGPSQPSQMELLSARVEQGLAAARKVFETTRCPVVAAGDADHAYDDKYLLAEFLTQTAVGSAFAVLQLLGLGDEAALRLAEAAKMRAVTLRFDQVLSCTLLREEKEEVEVPVTRTTMTTGDSEQGATTVTHHEVRTVTKWLFTVTATYELYAYVGNDPKGTALPLKRAERTATVAMGACTAPVSVPVKEVAEVDITWLLERLDSSGTASFAINRGDAECRTPLRNPEVAAALKAFRGLSAFADGVRTHFRGTLVAARQLGRADALHQATDVPVPLVPVVPVMWDRSTAGAAPAVAGGGAEAGTVLSGRDAEALLLDSRRLLDERCASLRDAFPADEGLVTWEEAKVCAALSYMTRVCEALAGGVEYIEALLRRQLVRAVGKEVTASDFRRYIDFHNRCLFTQPYAPVLFSYAIRRPGHAHDPEGALSLEEISPAGERAVATTVTRVRDMAAPFRFALSASADLTFTGKVYVHSYVAHRFSTERQAQVELVARAKQFSGFVVLLGQIGGKDLFLPKHAFLCQNKDEFKIPLALDEIPTPKEFKDAIASLSPEQQRFAKAYRAMQLEATLFGVCVIQVKPQLEKVLNLPPDALTKEIKLTQQLLDLFTKYHIASDLLSYQGDTYEDDIDVPAATKVAAVKAHVGAILEMVREAEAEETQDAKARAEFGRTAATSGFDGSGASTAAPTGGFGSAAPSGGLFGGSGANTAAASGFGGSGASTAAPTGGFGSAAPSGGLFGGSGANTAAASGFGGSGASTAAPTAPSGGLFGGSGANTAAASGFGGFGAPAAGGFGGFGAAASSSGGFGGFGAAAAPVAGGFGAAPAAGGFGGFGAAKPGGFGASAPAAGGFGGFGAAASSSGGFGGFGAGSGASTAAPTGGFGSAAPSGGFFGGSGANTAAASGFGGFAPSSGGGGGEANAFSTSSSSAPLHAGVLPARDELDVSALPHALETRYEALDKDSSVRPTIITAAAQWQKTSQRKLLGKPERAFIMGCREKDTAFDLLSALTRSGGLEVEHADLHVVIAATHCFDKTLMDTLVQHNVNPIEKVERSTLIVASTIHDAPAAALVKAGHAERVEALNLQVAAQETPMA